MNKMNKVVEKLEAEVARCQRAEASWQKDVDERPWDDDARDGVTWWKGQADAFRRALELVQKED